MYQGMTVLKMGMFEKTPVPEWESFVVKKQGFEGKWEGCIQYGTISKGVVMED
jgi:hypothetical protein